MIGDGKAEFSAVITPVFSINLSFRNNVYADLVLNKHVFTISHFENSCAA